MFLLWLYALVSQCLADPLLEGLYGVHGGNRVTLCTPKGGICDGAIWQIFIAARESCLRETSNADIYIKKGDVNCTGVTESDKKLSYTKILVRHRPQNLDDLALLQLSWPIPTGDVLNSTSGVTLFTTRLEEYVNEIDRPLPSIELLGNNSPPFEILLPIVILCTLTSFLI